jgi:hypothetical protein
MRPTVLTVPTVCTVCTVNRLYMQLLYLLLIAYMCDQRPPSNRTCMRQTVHLQNWRSPNDSYCFTIEK